MTPLEIAYHDSHKKCLLWKCLSWASNGIDILMLLVIVSIAVIQIMLPCIGIRVNYLVGTSMNPTLYEDDLIFIDTKTDTDNLETGSIIVFDNEQNESICHRVSSIEDDGKIMTKGDHNDVTDDIPITNANLTGQVIFVIPKGKPLLTASLLIAYAIISVTNIAAYFITKRYFEIRYQYGVLDNLYRQFCANNQISEGATQ